ncbi:MAG: DUF1761 domain-containing protein [Candidatus Sungbacteria bacterium]|uniref:DUF1761 domain-containing protein n=1 Tax=Candidatus Sungiibacteriota bacterium TaxID=2750080 RepID=A0A932YWJ8_9BACT|nr:DUF1761 domain-containing protein [Candidatus Sungbacteria bacterium]
MPQVPINYLAVLAAAIASFVLGFLWYGPLFGKQWKNLMGFTDESMKAMKMTPLSSMIGGFITSLVMSYVLAHALIFAARYLGTTGISAGLMAGFWNWLGFVATVTLGAVLWEGKSWKLWLLNNGYWLLSLLGMGVILALWT